MDESPNPDENEELGDATGPFFAVRMKKMAVGSLVGFMPEDALRYYKIRNKIG
jgi:hypothetical protein